MSDDDRLDKLETRTVMAKAVLSTLLVAMENEEAPLLGHAIEEVISASMALLDV